MRKLIPKNTHDHNHIFIETTRLNWHHACPNAIHLIGTPSSPQCQLQTFNMQTKLARRDFFEISKLSSLKYCMCIFPSSEQVCAKFWASCLATATTSPTTLCSREVSRGLALRICVCTQGSLQGSRHCTSLPLLAQAACLPRHCFPSPGSLSLR